MSYRKNKNDSHIHGFYGTASIPQSSNVEIWITVRKSFQRFSTSQWRLPEGVVAILKLWKAKRETSFPTRKNGYQGKFLKFPTSEAKLVKLSEYGKKKKYILNNRRYLAILSLDRKRIDTKGPVNQHSDVYFTLTVDNFTADIIDWETKVEVGFQNTLIEFGEIFQTRVVYFRRKKVCKP